MNFTKTEKKLIEKVKRYKRVSAYYSHRKGFIGKREYDALQKLIDKGVLKLVTKFTEQYTEKYGRIVRVHHIVAEPIFTATVHFNEAQPAFEELKS